MEWSKIGDQTFIQDTYTLDDISLEIACTLNEVTGVILLDRAEMKGEEFPLQKLAEREVLRATKEKYMNKLEDIYLDSIKVVE